MDQNETEIRRQLQIVRQIQPTLLEGSLNQKYLQRLMDIYQNPYHKILKLACYPLLKSTPCEDLIQLLTTLQQDIRGNDHEIQITALKLLYILPNSQILEFLQQEQSILQQFIDNKQQQNTQYHYEKLAILHSLFIFLQLQETQIDSAEYSNTLIVSLYTKITDNIFSVNRDVSTNCIICLTDLFQNASGKMLICRDNLSSINLDNLISQIINHFCLSVHPLNEKIQNYEIRIRSKMVLLICEVLKCMIHLQVKKYSRLQTAKYDEFLTEVKNFLKEGLFDGLIKYSFEIEVIIQACNAAFILVKNFKQVQIIWKIFDHILQYIQNIVYRKELNFVLINIVYCSEDLSPLPKVLVVINKIAIGMKILELVNQQMQNPLTRLIFMLSSFYNIISASINMLSQGRQSSLLGLFSQQWFLNKLKQEETSNTPEDSANNSSKTTNIYLDACSKEEILNCLIIAAIQFNYNEENKNYYHIVLMEVLDVTYRMIDWKNENLSKFVTLSIDLYLMLFEQAYEIIPLNDLQGRLRELLSRLNSNEINFLPKIKTLLMLVRRFNQRTLQPIGDIDFIQSLVELRSFMIQPTTNQHPLKQENLSQYINTLQIIYQAIYYLYLNFHSQQNSLKQNILELLSVINFSIQDFNDNLQELGKNKIGNFNVIQTLLDHNKQIIQTIFDADVVDRDFLTINIELTELSYSDQTKEPRELLQIAYNIFFKSQLEDQIILQTQFFEQDQPIQNLKSLNGYLKESDKTINIFQQLEMDARLISGVSDFVQLYCAHQFDVSSSQLCIGIRCYNLSPFKLDNVEIKLLTDINCSIEGNNNRLIEELPSYQSKQIFYVLKVDKFTYLQFSFDVTLQNVRTEQGLFSMRSQNYRVSLIEFLIPNNYHLISRQAFYQVWSDLKQSMHTSCLLVKNYLTLFKKLCQKPFGVVMLDEEETLFFLSKNREYENITLEIQRRNSTLAESQAFITIALLGYMMDGSLLAIRISNIETVTERHFVTVEMKSSSRQLLKKDQDQIILDLAEGILELMN